MWRTIRKSRRNSKRRSGKCIRITNLTKKCLFVCRRQQREIESLEARLSVAQKQLAATRKASNKSPSPAAHGEWAQQAAMNKRLREENSVLYDENEELKAMVEMLKAQVSGRMGLVSDPRASPFMGPTLSI